jgi:nitrogen regulatory protein P-II 1
MHLLVAVLNSLDHLDAILAGFVESGVRGATVINSEGMGRVLSHDIPIFAGLQTLLNRSGPENRTILTVVTAELIDPIISLIPEVVRRPGEAGDRDYLHASGGQSRRPGPIGAVRNPGVRSSWIPS